MAGVVDIVLPTGEAATVPEADLGQALAAGATRPVAPTGPDGGGLLGALATGAMGAASTGSFGLSDLGLSTITNLAGGDDLRNQVLGEVRQAREANPRALMAGEMGGLFLNPGMTAAGEGAEAATAARFGEGLLGRTASMGMRGAVEGAILGDQHQTTEDSLGDHAYNGQALYSSAAKDALLGGAAGAAFGVGSHFLGEAAGLLRRPKGPASDAVLDEIAGVPGAGRPLQAEAKQAEAAVEDLRKAGLTSDQAATAVDEINGIAKQASGGIGTDAADALAEAYVSKFAPEQQAVIRQTYANASGKLADAELRIERHAIDMSEKGTKVLRNLEDTMNEAQFGQKAARYEKLIDESQLDAQRDMVANLHQEMNTAGGFWDQLPNKGGAEGAIAVLKKDAASLGDALAGRRSQAAEFIPHPKAGHGDVTLMVNTSELEKAWQKDGSFYIGPHQEGIGGRREEFMKFQAQGKPVQASKLSFDKAGRASFEDGRHRFATFRDQGAERVAVTMDRESMKRLPKSWGAVPLESEKALDAAVPVSGRDLYMRLNKTKQNLDSVLRWGRENRNGLPEAISNKLYGLEALTNKIRTALEDSEVWGEAGLVQARENAAFSSMFARRNHFMDQLGVKIDQQAGVLIPEIDRVKVQSMLGSLTGRAETDATLQSVKSTEATISGLRDRFAALKQSGELSASDVAKMEAGIKDLDAFEASFKAAREESSSINRLKAAALEEREAGSLGGLIGLAGDVVTKPLQTMNRLAAVRNSVARIEEGVAAGLRKFFGGTADEAAVRIADKVALRTKDKIISEMEEIGSMRGNLTAQQDRASRLVGDLAKAAPKIAAEVQATAVRALDYLAREAPKPSVPVTLVGLRDTKGRYSDQQVSNWETKRRAALDPESVVRDLSAKGKLNRDAIKTVEFVSPKLFAKMQELAQEQLMKLEADGKLDKMPYQQKAAIATLLKIPADGTWKPDFIAMMQAAKVTPVAQSAPQGPKQPNSGVSKRAVEIDSGVYATEAGTIEQGRVA